MKFDINKVYTAINADELKVGSTVIVANNLSSLKTKVQSGSYSVTLLKIWGTSSTNRFEVMSMNDKMDNRYCLCYLVSEPKEKKLKWTDLKIGDVIRKGTLSYLVTGIYADSSTDEHIFVKNIWILDSQLENWEKVE